MTSYSVGYESRAEPHFRVLCFRDLDYAAAQRHALLVARGIANPHETRVVIVDDRSGIELEWISASTYTHSAGPPRRRFRRHRTPLCQP